MKTWIGLTVVMSCCLGCSTVQVARLDTTLAPRKTIALYQDRDALEGKNFKDIGYLAYDKPVQPGNYTKALGAVLDKARQLGADGLIVETPLEGITNTAVFRATAIVFEP